MPKLDDALLNHKSTNEPKIDEVKILRDKFNKVKVGMTAQEIIDLIGETSIMSFLNTLWVYYHMKDQKMATSFKLTFERNSDYLKAKLIQKQWIDHSKSN